MSERGEGAQEAVDRHFTRTADFWSDLYRDGRIGSIVYQERRDRALRAVERLGLPHGARVLELGAGAGELATLLARAGYAVTATDTVQAMLDRTARRAETGGLVIDVRYADAHSLPFPAASHDAVVALGVLPWLHSPERAVAEIARVLVPGGFAVVTVDNARRLNELFDPWLTWLGASARARLRAGLDSRSRRGDRPTYRRHRPRDLDPLFGAAGLETVSGEAVGFGPFTLYRRPALPDRIGLRLNAALQERADRGSSRLRGWGVHYLAVARKVR